MSSTDDDGKLVTRRIDSPGGPGADGSRWSTSSAPPASDERDQALLRRFTLLVTAGPDAGQRVVSTGERLCIGTHPSCDLVLVDPGAAPFHCEIALAGKLVVIRDLEGPGGTLVDGVSVVQAHLRGGSIVALGATQIRFDTGGEAARVPLSSTERFGRLVGASVVMRRVFAQLERAAADEGSLLLEGEPGTGKAAAAISIHAASHRPGPFVAVACGPAMAGDALAAALDDAAGGTLFLEDVGDLPAAQQVGLVRALERRGAGAPRILAATTRDLKVAVNRGGLRPELYRALAQREIRMPALRERADDLPLLVGHFLGNLGAAPPAASLRSRDFLLELSRRSWPRNVEELQDFLARAVALSAPPVSDPATPGQETLEALRERWRHEFDRAYLEELLRAHRGDVVAVARAAGVGPFHLECLLLHAKLP